MKLPVVIIFLVSILIPFSIRSQDSDKETSYYRIPPKADPVMQNDPKITLYDLPSDPDHFPWLARFQNFSGKSSIANGVLYDPIVDKYIFPQSTYSGKKVYPLLDPQTLKINFITDHALQTNKPIMEIRPPMTLFRDYYNNFRGLLLGSNTLDGPIDFVILGLNDQFQTEGGADLMQSFSEAFNVSKKQLSSMQWVITFDRKYIIGMLGMQEEGIRDITDMVAIGWFDLQSLKIEKTRKIDISTIKANTSREAIPNLLSYMGFPVYSLRPIPDINYQGKTGQNTIDWGSGMQYVFPSVIPFNEVGRQDLGYLTTVAQVQTQVGPLAMSFKNDNYHVLTPGNPDLRISEAGLSDLVDQWDKAKAQGKTTEKDQLTDQLNQIISNGWNTAAKAHQDGYPTSVYGHISAYLPKKNQILVTAEYKYMGTQNQLVEGNMKHMPIAVFREKETGKIMSRQAGYVDCFIVDLDDGSLQGSWRAHTITSQSQTHTLFFVDEMLNIIVQYEKEFYGNRILIVRDLYTGKTLKSLAIPKEYIVGNIRSVSKNGKGTVEVVLSSAEIIGILNLEINYNSASTSQTYQTGTADVSAPASAKNELYCFESELIKGKIKYQNPVFLQRDRIGIKTAAMAMTTGSTIWLTKILDINTLEEYILFNQSKIDNAKIGLIDNMKIMIWFRDSYGSVGGKDIYLACEQLYNQKVENSLAIGISSTELDWLSVNGVKKLEIILPDGNKKEIPYPTDDRTLNNIFKNNAKYLAEFDLKKFYGEHKAQIDKMNLEFE